MHNTTFVPLTPQERSDVHELLVRARNHLTQKPWGQHKAINADGSICPAGALNWATASTYGWPARATPRAKHARIKAQDLLSALIGYEVPSDLRGRSIALPRWNDMPSRRKEHVLALFDRGINATAPTPAVPKLELPEESREEVLV
jgi:hypothetical protein